jgi:hypothetical protein
MVDFSTRFWYEKLHLFQRNFDLFVRSEVLNGDTKWVFFEFLQNFITRACFVVDKCFERGEGGGFRFHALYVVSSSAHKSEHLNLRNWG